MEDRTDKKEWTELMIRHDIAFLQLSWTLLALNLALSGLNLNSNKDLGRGLKKGLTPQGGGDG